MDQQRYNNPKQDELNEEIRIMKRKLDDTMYQLSSMPKTQTVTNMPTSDNSRLLEQIENRLNDLKI